MSKTSTYWMETEFYGILGSPIGKSLSPAMHNANFSALGMNALYVPFEADAESAAKILPALGLMRFGGLNVTMPLKQSVIPLLDGLDESGELCGAINAVYWRGGGMFGANTDGSGFVRGLREQGRCDPAGKNCLIFGAGGAARGAAFALVASGAASVNIVGRASGARVSALASDLNAYRAGICHAGSSDTAQIQRLLRDSDIVINATPVGTPPNADATPFDTSLLERRHMVCDMLYTPGGTKLLREAAAIGCGTLPGHWMLIWQGVESFGLWMAERGPNVAPDVAAMTGAVLENLGDA